MKKIVTATLLGFVFFASSGPARAAEGQLDKDLIRRVVRAHIPEIRHCYNEALTRNPDASGSVVIDFTIGDQGTVTASEVATSDLGDDAASACMTTAVARWLFPKPDGGSVAVSYPFVLEPG